MNILAKQFSQLQPKSSGSALLKKFNAGEFNLTSVAFFKDFPDKPKEKSKQNFF